MASNIYDYNYKMKIDLQHRIVFTIFLIIILLVICSLSNSFLLFSKFITSTSMEPTLEKNNIIFVTPLIKTEKSLVHHKGTLLRGDVVYLKPLHQKDLNLMSKILDKTCAFFTFQQLKPFTNSHNMSESCLVRRILGFPGDTLYVKDYVLYIKEKGSEYFLTEFELSHSDYDILAEKTAFDEDKDFSTMNFINDYEQITLGENEYFILCDNRLSGVDSRIWGVVKGEQIAGKVILRYFPFTKFKIF